MARFGKSEAFQCIIFIIPNCNRNPNTLFPVSSVRYVQLIDDEKCSQTFEAIFGTLKAARKGNKLAFQGEILLKGAHDDTLITLV